MASTNTVVFRLDVDRDATNRGRKQLPSAVTLQDVEEVLIREKKLTADATGVAVNMDGLTARALIVYTTQPINLYLNGSATPVKCGSETVVLDTEIDELTVDNDLADPATDHTIEVWIIT